MGIKSYIAQLDSGVWATTGNGDRTLVIDSAKRFKTLGAAKRSITVARSSTTLCNCAVLAEHENGSIALLEHVYS
jgi:hypothetical protein